MTGAGTTRRGTDRRAWNLVWTVPLALLLPYIPASLVRFERCGIHQCLGEAVGFDSPLAQNAVAVAAFAAVMMFAALALTPWWRRPSIRIAVALCAAAIVGAGWVWIVLFYS